MRKRCVTGFRSSWVARSNDRRLPSSRSEHQLHRLHQPTAASAQTIVEFAADGSLDVGQLKSVYGFDSDSTVQLKAGGPVFRIAKVEGRDVTLIAADSSTKILTP